MEQSQIWDYFQGEGVASFEGAAPRARFLVRRAGKLAGKPRLAGLNIGIGSGVLERTAASRGWNIEGVDPSPVAVDRLKAAGIPATAGTIEQLPFEDARFDVVFATEVFEHLPADVLERGLDEIARVLRPRGWLVGTVPHDEVLSESETVCPDCGKRFHRWGHVQSFDETTLRAVLERRFDVTDLSVRAFPDFQRPSPKDKVKSAVRWTLGRFRARIANPTLYFAARRR